jgi:hypothetical protein
MTDQELTFVIAIINAIGEISKTEAIDAIEKEYAPSAVKQHDWLFYANGTFCRRCGVQLGSGQPCG